MSVRRVAADTLSKILDGGAYSNLALKEAARGMCERDVRFLYALVYTSLEHLYYIDFCLEKLTSRQKRVVRSILRTGAAQIIYMNTPAHAAVSASVELCRECGKGASAKLVNAVLRRLAQEPLPPLPTDPVERLCMEFSCPEWIVRLWADAYGLDFTRELLTAPALGMQLRAQYPTDTEQLITALGQPFALGRHDPNCVIPEKGFDVENHPLFVSGGMCVQSEGAMMIVRTLGDMRGKRVLDACAAPGGKSAYLYSLTRGDVDLTCFEPHPHRKALMDSAFGRLSVKAKTLEHNANEFDSEFEHAFDAVLLDVPCSGLGLIAEKIDIRFNKDGEDISTLIQLQRDILDCCFGYVKAGGVLVYSTCTINPDENCGRVKDFLSGHSEFVLELERQLFPNVDGTDGFYYARMRYVPHGA